MNELFIQALNNILNLALAQNTALAEKSELGTLTVEVMKNKRDIALVSQFLVACARASRAERAALDPNIAISVNDLIQL